MCKALSDCWRVISLKSRSARERWDLRQGRLIDEIVMAECFRRWTSGSR